MSGPTPACSTTPSSAPVPGSMTMPSSAATPCCAAARFKAMHGSANTPRWTAAPISGTARIGGHAYLSGATVSDNATVKGIGNQTNNYVGGDAVMDGDSFTSNSATNGFHFGYDWAGFINTSAPAGLFASYQFPTAHPYAAKDQYGATDGLLVGSPTWGSTDGTRSGFLTFNGSGQYVLLSRWLNDLRVGTFSARVKWAGGAANQAIFHFGDGTATTQMFVTPSNASGKCELKIKRAAPPR